MLKFYAGVPPTPQLVDARALGLSIEASHSTLQSFFGSCPFQLELKHKDVPLKTILEVIRVISKLTEEDKKR